MKENNNNNMKKVYVILNYRSSRPGFAILNFYIPSCHRIVSETSPSGHKYVSTKSPGTDFFKLSWRYHDLPIKKKLRPSILINALVPGGRYRHLSPFNVDIEVVMEQDFLSWKVYGIEVFEFSEDQVIPSLLEYVSLKLASYIIHGGAYGDSRAGLFQAFKEIYSQDVCVK